MLRAFALHLRITPGIWGPYVVLGMELRLAMCKACTFPLNYLFDLVDFKAWFLYCKIGIIYHKLLSYNCHNTLVS